MPVWRLWTTRRMTMTELEQASIDDVEDAWEVLEAIADAENREEAKRRKAKR